ncbi:MAG: type II toxin-antitoxin system PemK/MazF family toxin [Methylocystis sp.]|nr:type II toxin-antitoxin system PemK/MazF family toxin [Methylocystis sp.]
MNRREIWTVAGGNDYAGKPRPVVILQDDAFDQLDSVTICPLTTDPADLPLFRIVVAPSDGNGLRLLSRIMADKVTTIPKSKLGARIGRLADQDMVRLTRAIVVFLGLAS